MCRFLACLCSCLILGISHPSLAQSYKKKGFVILNSGDTLTGYIRYSGWNHNPSSISFYADSAKRSSRVYTVADLQCFQVEGYDVFERMTIPRSVSDPTDADTAGRSMDTVLLRLLVKGTKLSLYSFTRQGTVFFLMDSTSTLTALTGTEDQTETNERYKGILRYNALSYNRSDLLDAIDKTSFDVEGLSAIVASINGTDKQNSYSVRRINKHYLRWFMGAGGGVTKLSVSGYDDIMMNVRYGYSFIPSATIGFDLTGSHDLERSDLRAELVYSGAHYSGTGPATTTDAPVFYTIKQTNLTPQISYLYHFTGSAHWRFYLGASAGYSFSFYQENQLNTTLPEETYKNYLKVLPTWIKAGFRAGVRIDRHWEAGATGLILGSFTGSNQLGLTPREYSLNVFYHFGS